MIPFVDTDVIIRLITGDDLRKQQAAHAMFNRVRDGHLEVSAPVTMIADAVYVLQSARLYGVARPAIANILSVLVRLPSFHVQDRDAVLDALSIYGSSSLDFGDAYLVASMNRDGSNILYSYDQDFDSVPGVTRREP